MLHSQRRRQWHPTPGLLPGKSHGWRSLVGCSSLGRKSRTGPSNFTFTFHFHALEKEMAPHSSVLPGKSQGSGSLVGCRLWGCTDLDMTVRLHFHFSLSCVGEENGTPLQCSCPENPTDGGAWWAAVYGVAQSRTRLKRLSSSSTLSHLLKFKLVEGYQICLLFC